LFRNFQESLQHAEVEEQHTEGEKQVEDPSTEDAVSEAGPSIRLNGNEGMPRIPLFDDLGTFQIPAQVWSDVTGFNLPSTATDATYTHAGLLPEPNGSAIQGALANSWASDFGFSAHDEFALPHSDPQSWYSSHIGSIEPDHAGKGKGKARASDIDSWLPQ
jgi:hypothetical protein